MKLFRTKSRQHEMVGIEVTTDGIALAHIARVAGQPARLLSAQFLPGDEATASNALKEQINALNLKGKATTALMPADSYQLLLGEAPKVPESERNEALRWKVKDLVSFPVATAVIDSFLLNESCSRGGVAMAYVTAAPKAQVAALVSTLRDAALEISAIDIAELALARLVATGYDSSRPIALVSLSSGQGNLLMIKAGELYLARNFKLNYNGGLLDDIPTEPLMLELQRSLDYFERQLRQPPAAQILLCGENVTEDKISEELTASFAARIELLDLSTVITFDDSIDEITLSLCTGAIGAALREEEAV